MIARSPTPFPEVDCEVAFDNRTRHLYATDASIYQIEAAAVAFPHSAAQAGAAILGAAAADLSATPSGAGSRVAGGAVGDGLIVDFSCHDRQITELNLERGSVRVGAGVALLHPGFRFGWPSAWRAVRRRCSRPAVAEWLVLLECWKRNTTSHSK